MHATTPLPTALSALISSQSGVVSAAQAAEHGINRQVLRRIAREWQKLALGLYSTGPITWESALWASLLAGGQDPKLGGAAACFQHGLIMRVPKQITVWTRSQCSPLRVGEYRTVYRRGERRSRGYLPCTLVDDSLLDYASEATEQDVIEAVTRALSTRRTTSDRLLATANGRARVAKRKLFEQLCAPEHQQIESVLEWWFQKRVLERHKLSGFRRQVRIDRQSRVDVLFEEAGLVVELDGRSFHNAEQDARRDNIHALRHGVVTLRFTWWQVMHQPCEVALVVAQALEQRGTMAEFAECARCVGRSIR